MLLSITLPLLILQSVHGALYCDGVEINSNGQTIVQGAGICYHQIEDGSSFFLECTSAITMVQNQYDNAYCVGDPMTSIDIDVVMGARGLDYEITCCSEPCPYSKQTIFGNSCPSEDPFTTPVTIDLGTTEEPSAGYSIDINIEDVCQGGGFLYLSQCLDNTTVATGVFNTTGCSGDPVFSYAVSDDDCIDGSIYEVDCMMAEDTCYGDWTLPPFFSTEPIGTLEPISSTCDALQFYAETVFSDGGNVQPAGYCSSLQNPFVDGSYIPICNSVEEMVIEYYNTTNNCTGESTTKTVDELMEILDGRDASFVCCTGNPCPVLTGRVYPLADCSAPLSTSFGVPYPLTDTVGVCEDVPPDSSEMVTQCGDGIVIEAEYIGLGCEVEAGLLTFNATEGYCFDTGFGFFARIVLGCDEAEYTCPTPSPTAAPKQKADATGKPTTAEPTPAPFDKSKAASEIMILSNIMVGIGMFMMN